MRLIALTVAALISAVGCTSSTEETGDTNDTSDSGADTNTDTDTDGPRASFDYGGEAVAVVSAHAAFNGSGTQLNVMLSTSPNLCTYESGGYSGTDCEQNCAFISDHTGSDPLLTASLNIPLDSDQQAALEGGGSLDLSVTGSMGVWNTALADGTLDACLAACEDTWEREEGTATLTNLAFPSGGVVSVEVSAEFGFQGALDGTVATTPCAGL